MMEILSGCAAVDARRPATGTRRGRPSRAVVTPSCAVRAPSSALSSPASAAPAGRGSVVTRAAAAAAPAAVPVVKIDNLTDPLATIVEVEFGDLLGELLDTTAALKNLDLNIVRATLAGGRANKFYVTEAKTSEKVTASERVEEIRQCVLSNMMQYHPEAIGALSPAYSPRMAGYSPTAPLGNARTVAGRTSVAVTANGPARSAIAIETPDRPGLLVDIVALLKDMSLNVVSAEIDTVGAVAKDVIFCTYKGEALNSSMVTLVTNVLEYYLTMAEVEKEESY